MPTFKNDDIPKDAKCTSIYYTNMSVNSLEFASVTFFILSIAYYIICNLFIYIMNITLKESISDHVKV